ncbi:MAG: type pilus assembly protein PilB [Patescibacteria group bacterium]|nr:type pilus assembly protein PilB [Patescibacteria group bacterium]
MPTNPANKIETVLLEKGLLSKTQVDAIKRIQLSSGKSALEILEENRYVDAETLVKARGEISGIQYYSPTSAEIKPNILQLIPEKYARKYKLLPIETDSYTLKVAMADPFDLDVIQFLERTTKKVIQPLIAVDTLLVDAIDKQYGRGFGDEVTQVIERAAETTTEKIQESLSSIEQADDIIKVSPVAKIVSVILEYAVKSGASDIHIEAEEGKTRIRYRIDGVLQEKFPLPKSIHNSIIARIKILANMPIDERRKPLDGKFKVEVGNNKTDLRISTLPTVNGEKCVIRLLKSDNQILSLDQLGLWGDGNKIFVDGLSQNTGILLVTGPTGSGKTLTLATSLARLNSPKVNIITLEDPVEISIPGVNQVQINTAAGLTFANGLRAILRQDPNIIMVGEIRDVETAKLAIQAALTGHLVLATLHTNSAAGAIPRLIDMGVEPFLLSSTINVALAQRLTRRVCEACKTSYEADPIISQDIKRILGDRLLKIALAKPQLPLDKTGEALPVIEAKKIQEIKQDSPQNGTIEIKSPSMAEIINANKTIPTSLPTQAASGTPAPSILDQTKLILYKGKGCKECNNTGYKGRIGLYEIMKITTNIQDLVEASASADTIQRKAEENGLITLVQDGYIKALWGLTTLEEVLSVADEV